MASAVANSRTHTPVVGTTPRPRTETRTQDMPVDLYETREAVVLRALVPGVDKRDLKVAAHGSVLWITADRKRTEDVRLAERHRQEVPYGKLRRGVQVPASADATAFSHTLRNGVLEVRFRKRRPAARGQRSNAGPLWSSRRR